MHPRISNYSSINVQMFTYELVNDADVTTNIGQMLLNMHWSGFLYN